MTLANLNYWFLQTLAMMLTALLIPGLKITGPLGAFASVVSVAFVNSHIWDAALFLQIPDSLSSRAALLFLSNGLIFWLLVKILPGIEVKGIVPALIAPVVFSFCSMIIQRYGPLIDWGQVLDFSIKQLSALRDYFSQPDSNVAHKLPLPSSKGP